MRLRRSHVLLALLTFSLSSSLFIFISISKASSGNQPHTRQHFALDTRSGETEVLNVVLLVSRSTIKATRQLVGSIHFWHPSWTLSIYASDLHARHRSEIKSWAHTEFIALRDIPVHPLLADIFPNMPPDFYASARASLSEIPAPLLAAVALHHASNTHPRVLYISHDLVLHGRVDALLHTLLNTGALLSTDYPPELSQRTQLPFASPMLHGYLHRSATYDAFLIPLLRCAFPTSARSWYGPWPHHPPTLPLSPSSSSSSNIAPHRARPTLTSFPTDALHRIRNASWLATSDTPPPLPCTPSTLLHAGHLALTDIQQHPNIMLQGVVSSTNLHSRTDYARHILLRNGHAAHMGDSLAPDTAAPNLHTLALLVLTDPANALSATQAAAHVNDPRHTPLIRHLASSMAHTLDMDTKQIQISLYVGFVSSHPVYSVHTVREQLAGLLRDLSARAGHGTRTWKVRFVDLPDNSAHLPGFQWNKLADAAYDDNQAFLLMCTEHTRWLTLDWASLMLKPLLRTRGIGAVMPALNLTAGLSLSHAPRFHRSLALVSRTHMHIHGHLLPSSFASARYLPYWLANLYRGPFLHLPQPAGWSGVRLSFATLPLPDHSPILTMTTRCNQADCLRFIQSQVRQSCTRLQQHQPNPHCESVHLYQLNDIVDARSPLLPAASASAEVPSQQTRLLSH